MDLKKLLPYQRSLFILGDAGSERYTLFSSLSSAHSIFERMWHPEESLFKQCTWVIYSGEEQRILKETKKGLMNVDRVDSVGTYYIAVHPGQLPHNIKLVFPPYHLDEASFRGYYAEHSCLTKSSVLLWLEGFPYGKSDTAQQLRYLQDLINDQERIVVAITQMERKFLSTDIGNVEVGIQHAVQYFEQKGYRVLAERAQIPMQRSLLLDALTYHMSFSEKINSKYFGFIETVQASLDFLEDDIRFALEVTELLVALEEAFSFKKVRSNQNISQLWLLELQAIYQNIIVKGVKSELYRHYHLIDIKGEIAAEKELTQLFDFVWSDFKRDIKKHGLPAKMQFSNELQYELEVQKFKSEWRKVFSSLVKVKLPEACRQYLQTMSKPYLQNV